MTSLFRQTLLCLALLGLAACGGGGSSGTSGPQTATVGIALTDAPTTDVDKALATITSIDLLGDDGQVNVFSGVETVDLLKLADYSELFAVRDDVPAGTYNKIRLHLSRLELIRLDDNGDVLETIVPKLVANGKIDLNPQGSFYVAPGATLVITIDFDVGKSLKITETGNGVLIVRPVIFVDISNGLPSPGLTRLHGLVSDITVDGTFRLCQTALASSRTDDRTASQLGGDGHCVRVRSDDNTGLFGEDGLPQEFSALTDGDEVTAIGRLRPTLGEDDDNDAEDDNDNDNDNDNDSDGGGDSDSDGDDGDDSPLEHFDLDAYVIEEGPLGTFARLRGLVDVPVDAATDSFKLNLVPGQAIVSEGPLLAQLYPKSRIFSPDGVELDRLDIEVGKLAQVDSVLAIADGSPDILRTSLVVLNANGGVDEQVLTGELLAVDALTGQLIVADTTGDKCVDAGAADIFLVSDSGGSLDSERGTLADLTTGQKVNVFGRVSVGGCLVAETILAQR